MMSTDGKFYATDCANTETMFRIIQSIPSPKVEPLKRWLARVGKERIDEIENPELAKRIKAGSTHWLRHTAATHQIEAGVDPLIVQANLRHASFGTTELYIHKSRDRQHAETEKHKAGK